MHFFPMIIKSKYQKENLHKINKNKQMTKRNKIKDEKYNKMRGRIQVYLHNNAPTKIVISQQLQKHPQNKSLLTINIYKTEKEKRESGSPMLIPPSPIFIEDILIYTKKKKFFNSSRSHHFQLATTHTLLQLLPCFPTLSTMPKH